MSYLLRFATIRRYSPLFETIRTIRDYSRFGFSRHPRQTKRSPIIILALPLLLRKCCSVPLESVLPCNLGAQKNRVFKGMLVAQSREHRCRNKCFVHSRQSHRRKRNRGPSRIPKRKLVRLYCKRKKRKHLKILLKHKVPRSSEVHYFCKKSKVTFWITRYS